MAVIRIYWGMGGVPSDVKIVERRDCVHWVGVSVVHDRCERGPDMASGEDFVLIDGFVAGDSWGLNC